MLNEIPSYLPWDFFLFKKFKTVEALKGMDTDTIIPKEFNFFESHLSMLWSSRDPILPRFDGNEATNRTFQRISLLTRRFSF